MGGYRVQGRGEEAARKLLDQAHDLEKAGAFAIVLEGDAGRGRRRRSPAELQIPTIGIGAGPGTDAQVLVINDLLGLNERVPKFAKPYADLRGDDRPRRRRRSRADVEAGTFPDEDAHATARRSPGLTARRRPDCARGASARIALRHRRRSSPPSPSSPRVGGAPTRARPSPRS